VIHKKLLPHRSSEMGTASEAVGRHPQPPCACPFPGPCPRLEAQHSTLLLGSWPRPELLPTEPGRHQGMVHKMTTPVNYRQREQMDGRLKQHIQMGTRQQMGILQK